MSKQEIEIEETLKKRSFKPAMNTAENPRHIGDAEKLRRRER
ncbi:MAG: hypothetical protein NWE93_06490 [Candidatus Bathyarchaeota archaeon]|nr:hypothetical protein [Candidatus Bathyarchaeota archaeon]